MLFPKIESSSWLRFATVMAVCVCSFFIYGSSAEVTLMEARNFVAAREIVAGGSWLLPTMNGELRLAKPPFPTWCVAGIQLLTGGGSQDLGLLRFPAALAATLLVCFFWGLCRELTRGLPGEVSAPGRTAWIAALVLASSLLVVQVGREGQWDIFANCWLVGALWLLLQGWRQHGWASFCSLLATGLLVGLSFLSKGPVALYAILVPFLVAYVVYTRDSFRQKISPRAVGTGSALVVALLLCASWPLYLWFEVAPLALAVARTEMAAWGERHTQPFWYYWSFFAFTGPWALVAFMGGVWPYARKRAGQFVPYALVLGWLFGEWLLLSIIPEKKERYMLPLMFPLALVIGGLMRYFETTFPLHSTDQRLLKGWSVLLIIVLAAVPIGIGVSGLTGLGIHSWRLYVGVGVFGGLSVWVYRSGLLAQCSTTLMHASLSGMCAFLLLLLPVYPVWKSRKYDTHLRLISHFPKLRSVAKWRSLDTIHMVQVWQAGKPVPVWHPSLDSLRTLEEAIVVVSASPLPARLPGGWETSVTLSAPDTFYLGRKRDAGVWFLSIISPIHQRTVSH